MKSPPRLNCPNCGAPVTGPRCEYCGTLFLDFGALSMDAPTYIRIRMEDKYLFFRGIIRDIELKSRPTPVMYAWNDPAIIETVPFEYELNFSAVGAPSENGLVFIESETPTIEASTQEAAGMERRAGA